MPSGQPRSERRPLAAPLPEQSILPRYAGGSIANLPPTIGRLLGVEEGWVAPPLEELLDQSGPPERVILLLLDGIGWNRLQRELSQGSDAPAPGGRPHRGELLGDERLRHCGQLTSVLPSTTSVATTVLLGNGAAPAETGMLGYTFLLPDLGVLANMLRWHPVAHPGAGPGELERWGLIPERFLPTPSLAQVLGSGGVATRALLPAAISATPLSRMQLRGAEVAGYLNWLDMFRQLRRWSEESSGRSFAYAYLSDFDASSHRDGPDDGLWGEQWSWLSAQILRFMEDLPAVARGRTLLLVSADHGHVATPRDARSHLQDLASLPSLTSLGPGGEARHVNLYARGGRVAELLAYCREELGARFTVLAGEEALAAGLYGPAERAHPQAAARLGDVLLLARGRNHLWDRDSPVSLQGMHGSLEPDEMLVPLLAFRP